MYKDITGEQVKKSIEENKLTEIPIRNCSMCKETLYYRIKEGEPYIDTNCDCVTYTTPATVCSWDHLAESINMQSADEWKLEIAKSYGMTLEKMAVENEI